MAVCHEFVVQLRRVITTVADLVDEANMLDRTTMSAASFSWFVRLLDGLDPTAICDRFITSTCAHWPALAAQLTRQDRGDDATLLSLMSSLCFTMSQDDVRRLLVACFSVADRRNLFDSLVSLIRLSLCHIHHERSPYSRSTPRGAQNTYANDRYDDIVDLRMMSSAFDVSLSFPPVETTAAQ